MEEAVELVQLVNSLRIGGGVGAQAYDSIQKLCFRTTEQTHMRRQISASPHLGLLFFPLPTHVRPRAVHSDHAAATIIASVAVCVHRHLPAEAMLTVAVLLLFQTLSLKKNIKKKTPRKRKHTKEKAKVYLPRHFLHVFHVI